VREEKMREGMEGKGGKGKEQGSPPYFFPGAPEFLVT